ncbi:hypothetical protein [Rhizobium skierniewicense]|uniref:hypothetical protein n=1 Tax=Rhizobium skierniewicense TaxID=984260 RepID=UPI0015730C77|nr:hypothetical protein [Rhizobium skierniewicense]NTF31543.1 hypothetical protein [Rhizobium skierniewicense]
MVSGLANVVKLASTELALKAIHSHAALAADAAEHVVTGLPLPITTEKTDVEGITGLVFLKNLKTTLIEMSKDPTSAFQGQAMLKAADASALRIFDPIEGVVITAWSASDTQNASDRIDAIGWSPFLKQHIKRAQGTAYVKDDNGSYIDLISGESAYFGTVGNKYYYFTWPQ